MSKDNTDTNTQVDDKQINFEISRNFDIWLNNNMCSLICTSYKTNLVFTFISCLIKLIN